MTRNLLTSSQAKELDQIMAGRFFVSALQLMENAGSRVEGLRMLRGEILKP